MTSDPSISGNGPPTTSAIPGIHHISAICGDPRRNLDFYSGLLGLRLVKRTVNFDDPGSYHLYYGDGVGTPGTLMTFFAWTGAPPLAPARGRPGTGQITTVPFSVAVDAIDFWVDRLARAAVDFDGPVSRFGRRVITVRDPEDMTIEIVGELDRRQDSPSASADIPAGDAIRRLGGATLHVTGFERTVELLTETLGLSLAGEEGTRFRFAVGEGAEAAWIDLCVHPEESAGRVGIGTVHHIAFRAPSPGDQERWRAMLVDLGYDVTPILDRLYFRSIYFREPSGIVVEIATDGPGFLVDEPVETLGASLRLPPWLEPRRERIEAKLPSLPPPRRPFPKRT